MIVLGLSGAFGLPGEAFVPQLPNWFFHDSSAVIVRDGEVLAAVEEERVTRAKHTNTLAVGAARDALKAAKLDARDVDAVAYFFSEAYANVELGLQYAENPDVPVRDARNLLTERLSAALRHEIPPDRFVFVKHHDAHAHAAYHHSGFEEALVAIFDGNGEEDSISIYEAGGGRLGRLHTEPPEKSFGHLYCQSIELLGYKRFDEYKVMGLAPYGDPKTFREAFAQLVRFHPEGAYDLDVWRVRAHFLRQGFRPRRRGEPFAPIHRDFAAALQEMLEKLALHVLEHWRRKTGLANLCMAGGVAHNCSMNGTVARSGLFDQMFVHPASHDAGAALGAALAVSVGNGRAPRPRRLGSIAWGMAVDGDEVDALLSRWAHAVEEIPSDNLVETAADLLADGQVAGWARGRMEFGPRALGRRSILADPRPLENRERINAMIKKREAYRPFAPMVLAECVGDWFDVPKTRCNLEHMVFTVPVREDRRAQLAAVTHVDGTARLQSVWEEDAPDIASLLRAFARRTDVPILLNTSFNIDAEPIVGTAGEALLCFLGTELDILVLGDRILRRRPLMPAFWLDLVLTRRPDVEIAIKLGGEGKGWIAFTFTGGRSLALSPAAAQALARVDGERPLRDCGLPAGDETIDLIRQIIAMRFFRVVGLDARRPG